jgi:hypothetical protein
MRPRSRTISPDAYLDWPCGRRLLTSRVGVLPQPARRDGSHV